MKQYKLGKPNEQYRLNTGDRLVLEDSLFSGFDVVYAGKPSDNIFSLLCTEHEAMTRRMQGNLFFPVTQKTLNLHDISLDVLAVDVNSILLRYVG